MEEKSPVASGLPTAHTVPTHLALADTVLSLGYVTLSSRQLLLLLVGGSFATALWARTARLATAIGPVGAALHWLLLVLASVLILALTFGEIAGRPLDAWVIVVLAYFARPRLYLWRSMRACHRPSD